MIPKYFNKKFPGIDLIMAEAARCLPKKDILLLTYIYNAIVRLSYFTILWKFSQIIIFAKSNKPPDIPTSYRPINLLHYISKIYEGLIRKWISSHILSDIILPSSHFDFRAKHSTIHQVYKRVNAICLVTNSEIYIYNPMVSLPWVI